MVSSSGNNDKVRKDKTLKAHKMLLFLDDRDISGSITFHFKKGEGIVQSEIRDVERWNGTTNTNNILEFRA
jgi:hypothetical protein